MRLVLLLFGLLLLFSIEILRVYFIMPFPGSQHSDTVGIAYFLNNNMLWLRIIALLVVLPPLLHYLQRGRTGWKIVLMAVVAFYGVVVYFFNFRFLAEKMFYQPREKIFAAAGADTTGRDKLVIGVALKGDAKAYPIEIIGYHHQVKDTVGGQPVLVTYCTVCRTGRVYSPFIRGHYTSFRLVGMDHFNAMFEDEDTKSWWQQATGLAITGPLKGRQLTEVPSAQMRLGDWMALHPNSRTLQPDTNFRKRYADLEGYNEGTIKGSLEKRDSGSWKFKSWVIGVSLHGKSKAYDWNRLVINRFIQDTIGQDHLLLTLEPNNKTFYVLATADSFRYDSAAHGFRDQATQSFWQPDGNCTSGPLKGQKLMPVQAYQEFWHSWKTFHPGTGKGGI